MSLFSRLFKSSPKKSISVRRRIPGELAHAHIQRVFAGQFAKNYCYNNTKRAVAVTTREVIEAASYKSFKARIEGCWECEDIARALVNEIQLFGRSEGCSHACGTLVALDATDKTTDSKQDRHVWLWCIIDGGGGSLVLALFDATQRQWSKLDDVSNITFTDC